MSDYIRNFLVGVNLPWIDGQYDHDFGTNMTRENDVKKEDVQPTFQNSKQNFESYLKHISEMGIKIVRLWLFERFEGLTFGPTGEVIGISTVMTNNLREACQIAKKYDIQFYFCLMDSWGLISKSGAIKNENLRKKYCDIANGLITTDKKTQSFIKYALELLSHDIIYDRTWAVDVINEPDGLTRESSMYDKNRGNYDTGINLNHLKKYVNYSCDELRKNNFRVSCGLNKEWIHKFKDCHVDFFDIHIYDDNGNVPSLQSLNLKKNCIIGECGPNTNRNNQQPYDSKLHQNAIINFLRNSSQNGYSACFPWEYGSKNVESSMALIDKFGNPRPVVDDVKKFISKYGLNLS